MTTLHQCRTDPSALSGLLSGGPRVAVHLDEVQRRSLATRFRSVAAPGRLRLDAWSVEVAGRRPRPFAWSATLARRSLGRGGLARKLRHPRLDLVEAVREELDELAVAAAAGYARRGSLAHWFAGQPSAVSALATAEAVSWAGDLLELLGPVGLSWTPCPADAYYDVAAARTTLRGQRDAVVTTPQGRTIVRVRGGAPSRHAGAGLRCDLVVDALADVEGRLARRAVGLWPDAGIALAVDGTIDDARAGARDLVRAAVSRRREELAAA